MARPRFLLVNGITGPDRSNQRSWPGQPTSSRQQRPDRPPVRGTRRPEESWTAWRMLGRNNRELGRSPVAFVSVPACLIAIEQLRARIDEATRLLSVDLDTGRWRWRLEVDGVVLAISSRSYQRQRECHYSVEQFINAAASADLPAVAVDVSVTRTSRPAEAGPGDEIPGGGPDDAQPPTAGPPGPLPPENGPVLRWRRACPPAGAPPEPRRSEPAEAGAHRSRPPRSWVSPSAGTG